LKVTEPDPARNVVAVLLDPAVGATVVNAETCPDDGVAAPVLLASVTDALPSYSRTFAEYSEEAAFGFSV
jgi:hypothetical protein